MSRSHDYCQKPEYVPERFQVRQATFASCEVLRSPAMITTSYTRLVLDCHREELSNRFHLVTNGYFAGRQHVETPESYRVPPTPLLQPLPVGREALDRGNPEMFGTA